MKNPCIVLLFFLAGCSANPEREKIYFSYSGWAELEKYDSRTRIYEKTYSNGPDIKLRVPSGILNVELIVAEARKIVSDSEYEGDAEEPAGAKSAGATTGTSGDEEVCVVAPCFPPEFEYGIGSKVIRFRQECICMDTKPPKYDEMEALFQLLDNELNKYGKIARLRKNSGCIFY